MLQSSFCALLSGIRRSCWASRPVPPRFRSTGRWPGGAGTSPPCVWWRWTSTSGCRPGTRRRSRRTSSARSPRRWGSRRSTSWFRGGARQELEARIARAGRGRPAAARDRPQRAPGLQRAAGRRWTPAAGWWLSARRPGGTTRGPSATSPCRRMRSPRGSARFSRRDTSCCSPPAAAKADAVAAALTGPVTPDCPASVVQRAPQVTVVLDRRRRQPSSGGGASTARSASASTIHSCSARTCLGVEACDVAQPHPGLDAADAAQRDRQLMDRVVAEPLAEGFECLLEPRDHPTLAEWEVMRCVAEREPEHGPLNVLGLRDAVDHSRSDGSDPIEGLRGCRVREHRRAGGLRERRGQQLRLRREVAVGGGAGDAGCLGGLLDARGVSALHQLPRGGHSWSRVRRFCLVRPAST